MVLSSKYLLYFFHWYRFLGSLLLHEGPMFGISPAFWAIITSEPIRRCWRLHNPVIRRGSMHPSLRRYWLKISTSVCLISNPRLHWGQNCCPLPHLASVTCCSIWFDRGEATYSALMTSASFWVVSFTAEFIVLKLWFWYESLQILTFFKLLHRCDTEWSHIVE